MSTYEECHARTGTGYMRPRCRHEGTHHEPDSLGVMRHWCGTHAPSKVKARADAREALVHAATERRRAASARAQRIRDAERAVIAAAKAWTLVGDGTVLHEAVRALEKAES